MNLIPINPDNYTTEVIERKCPFHQNFPSEHWSGCTCSAAFLQRKATPEEREAKIKARLEKEKLSDAARQWIRAHTPTTIYTS